MRRLLPQLLLAALPLAAAPATAQNQVHLAWNDCGSYGQSLRTFACNTNSGNHVLVLSFVTPVAFDQLVAFEATLEVFTNSAALPSWWSLKAAGSCRPNLPGTNMDFSAGPLNCYDYWQNLGASGAAYDAGFYGTNTARLRLIAAIPQSAISHLDVNVEVYALKIQITNQKTVGTSGCPGCDVAAAIAVRDLKLEQPAGVGDYLLLPTDDSSVASWQCPVTLGTDGPPFFHCVVPVQPKSWGRIKSLYR